MYHIFAVSSFGVCSSPVATVKHGRNLLRSLRRACWRTHSCCAALMPTPFGDYWLCMTPSDPSAAFLAHLDFLETFFCDFDIPQYINHRAELWRTDCAFAGEYVSGTSNHLSQLFSFRVARGLY